MLIVEDITKRFASRGLVLNGLSFGVKPHAFTAILGRSGAGKTTLMRCLLGLIKPDSGRIWFQETDLVTASPYQLRQAQQKLAFITQQLSLVRRRTALDNAIAARLADLPLWRCLLNQFPRSLLKEGLTSLARVQLVDHAFHRSEHLSGGEQQRVAIARALTQKAKVILADEPVSSLDPQSAHTVLTLLKSLCEQEGITVLCNLHQVELAQRYSDHILGIRHGELCLDKPTSLLRSTDLRDIYSWAASPCDQQKSAHDYFGV